MWHVHKKTITWQTCCVRVSSMHFYFECYETCWDALAAQMPASKGQDSGPPDKRQLHLSVQPLCCFQTPRTTSGLLQTINLILAAHRLPGRVKFISISAIWRVWHLGCSVSSGVLFAAEAHSSVSAASVLALSKATAVFWLESCTLNESVSFKQPAIQRASLSPSWTKELASYRWS